MVILRPTRKLRPLLSPAATSAAASDTALGDWYVNRIVVDRQPLLLLVSSTSLLAMVGPARDVRGLPDRLSALVAARLARCGAAPGVIEAERQAMSPVVIGPTADRSVLGIMVDFAKSLPYYLGQGPWSGESLALAEDRLAATPCHAGLSFDRVVFPDQKAPDLLRVKWKSDERPDVGEPRSPTRAT